jgi:hypothetical protein
LFCLQPPSPSIPLFPPPQIQPRTSVTQVGEEKNPLSWEFI